MSKIFHGALGWIGLAILVAGAGYSQISGLPADTTVRVVNTAPASGSYPGQMIVVLGTTARDDPSVQVWNVNDGVWETIGGDAADLTPATLTTTGDVTVGDQLVLDDGTVDAPSFYFASNDRTGLYRVAANQVGMAVNGSLVHRFTNAQFYSAPGTFALPSLAPNDDGNTGLYFNGGAICSSTDSLEGLCFRVEKTVLTAAEVQALQTTPISVTHTPAATEVIIFLGAKIMLNADGADDFAGVGAGEDLVIQYETSGLVVSAVCDTATCIDLDAATADSGWIPALTSAGYSTTANLQKALQISEDGGGDGFTGGADTDFEIVVYYLEQTQNN